MSRLAAALRRNPVRLYLYGVLVAGEAVAVGYGLSANTGALWLGLAAAVLIVPATEAARAQVTPTAAPRTVDGEPAALVRALPPDPDGELKEPPGGSWLR